MVATSGVKISPGFACDRAAMIALASAVERAAISG
jgi:hypothetical protein